MPFQILSLSGGGYLGLYTISILADIEDLIGAPLGTRFDLIAGTSVGGIIAIGIANEIPAARIKQAFERTGRKFSQPDIHPGPLLASYTTCCAACSNRNTTQGRSETRSSKSSVPIPASAT
jgi:predicted acylesterase/phospholipase RssA